MKLEVPAGKIIPVPISGRFLDVAVATKPFVLGVIGSKFNFLIEHAREGTSFDLGAQRFEKLVFDNSANDDDLTLHFTASPFPIGQRETRVPATRLTPMGLIMAVATPADETDGEFDGVRGGRRRKQIGLQRTGGTGTAYVQNDGSTLWLLSSDTPTWTLETDAQITVVLASGTCQFTGFETFHL